MCDVCEHIKGNSAQMVLGSYGETNQILVKMGKLIGEHYVKDEHGGHYQVDFEIPINYCPKCGVRSYPNVCPRCHKRVEDEWNFCAYCNEELKEGK